MHKEFKTLGRDLNRSKKEAIREGDRFKESQLDDIHMEDPNEDEASASEERDTYQRESTQYPAEGIQN